MKKFLDPEKEMLIGSLLIGNKPPSKYIHKHIYCAISMKDILKPESIGKPINSLYRNDFQDWFLQFCWGKSRGMRGVDENGQDMSSEDLQRIMFSMYRDENVSQ